MKLRSFWPDSKFDIPWGMGPTYFNERDPRAGKDGVPANKTLLSNKTFCHSAASGAVLHVDPDNERWCAPRILKVMPTKPVSPSFSWPLMKASSIASPDPFCVHPQ
jgi:hypothetical protein